MSVNTKALLPLDVEVGNQVNELTNIVYVQPHVSPSIEYGPWMHVSRRTYRSRNLGREGDEFDGTDSVAHATRKEADHFVSSRSLQMAMDNIDATMNVMTASGTSILTSQGQRDVPTTEKVSTSVISPKVTSGMNNTDLATVRAMAQREGTEKLNRVRSVGNTKTVPSTIKGGNHSTVTITDDTTFHTTHPVTRSSKIKETGVRTLAVSRQPSKKGARLGKKSDFRKPPTLTLGAWISPMSKKGSVASTSNLVMENTASTTTLTEAVSVPVQWIANYAFDGAPSFVNQT
ncbi:hypothetical protein V6N13_050946 [Hibiscus sabdariffa]